MMLSTITKDIKENKARVGSMPVITAHRRLRQEVVSSRPALVEVMEIRAY
jgi:hypothetical protein